MTVLSRSFKDTVKARLERDPDFCAALLAGTAEQRLAGDIEVGKALMRTLKKASGRPLPAAVGR